jgi:hypothetical protein
MLSDLLPTPYQRRSHKQVLIYGFLVEKVDYATFFQMNYSVLLSRCILSGREATESHASGHRHIESAPLSCWAM